MKQLSVSQSLTQWLKDDSPKTIHSLIRAFGSRSFAVAFALLPVLAAVPVPSLGLSNILAIISMLFALQLLLGRTTPWLPKWLSKHSVPQSLINKVIPYIAKRLQKIETQAKRRYTDILEHRVIIRIIAICIAIFSLMACVAPPFTNLDTPPALAVIFLGLGMLFGDGYLALVGLAFGIAGVLLFSASAGLVVIALQNLFMLAF